MTKTLINTESYVETIKYTTDEFESGSGLTAVNRSMCRQTLKKRIPAVTKSTNDCLWANLCRKNDLNFYRISPNWNYSTMERQNATVTVTWGSGTNSLRNVPEALAPTIWNGIVRTCGLWSNHTVYSGTNELERFPYDPIHLLHMRNDNYVCVLLLLKTITTL